jgi:hypothetical protein
VRLSNITVFGNYPAAPSFTTYNKTERQDYPAGWAIVAQQQDGPIGSLRPGDIVCIVPDQADAVAFAESIATAKRGSIFTVEVCSGCCLH